MSVVLERLLLQRRTSRGASAGPASAGPASDAEPNTLVSTDSSPCSPYEEWWDSPFDPCLAGKNMYDKR